MPPTSKTLYEEGAQIKSFKLVRKGVYDRDGLVKLLCDDPAQYAGCSGSRCFRDVESDLHAQIAANRKGIQLIDLLVDEWGLETVQAVSETVHCATCWWLILARSTCCIFATMPSLPCAICYARWRNGKAQTSCGLATTWTTVRRCEGAAALLMLTQRHAGSPIELRVTIDPEKGSAIFDFEV